MRANTPLPRNVSLYVICLCFVLNKLVLYFVSSFIVDYMFPLPSLDATMTPDYSMFNPPVGSVRALCLHPPRSRICTSFESDMFAALF